MRGGRPAAAQRQRGPAPAPGTPAQPPARPRPAPAPAPPRRPPAPAAGWEPGDPVRPVPPRAPRRVIPARHGAPRAPAPSLRSAAQQLRPRLDPGSSPPELLPFLGVCWRSETPRFPWNLWHLPPKPCSRVSSAEPPPFSLSLQHLVPTQALAPLSPGFLLSLVRIIIPGDAG